MIKYCNFAIALNSIYLVQFEINARTVNQRVATELTCVIFNEPKSAVYSNNVITQIMQIVWNYARPTNRIALCAKTCLVDVC